MLRLDRIWHRADRARHERSCGGLPSSLLHGFWRFERTAARGERSPLHLPGSCSAAWENPKRLFLYTDWTYHDVPHIHTVTDCHMNIAATEQFAHHWLMVFKTLRPQRSRKKARR
jgi:hypothetical protein